MYRHASRRGQRPIGEISTRRLVQNVGQRLDVLSKLAISQSFVTLKSIIYRECFMKRIATKYLNLRREPLVKPSTLIVGLPFGHPVAVVKPSTRTGWFEVTTEYQNNEVPLDL